MKCSTLLASALILEIGIGLVGCTDPAKEITSPSLQSALVQAQGTWSARSPLLTTMAGLVAVKVPAPGDKTLIYAMAGFNCVGVAPGLEVYDPVTDSWTQKAPLPEARNSPSGAVYRNGKIYLFGGTFLGGSTTLEYDVGTDTWTDIGAIPPHNGTDYGVAAVINGRIFSLSGDDGSEEWKSFLSEFRPLSRHWTSRATAPNRHSRAASGVIGGKLYVAGGLGGFDGSTVINTLDVYDPATNSWTTRAPMPTGRFVAAGAVFHGKLYVFGGVTEFGVNLDVVEVYDPMTDTWSTDTSTPSPRSDMAAVVVGGDGNRVAYLIGGSVGAGGCPAVATNERFTP